MAYFEVGTEGCQYISMSGKSSIIHLDDDVAKFFAFA